MEAILSRLSVSVSELKRSPASVIKQAEGQAVAVLSHNKPAAYLVSPLWYERMLELMEDMEDAKLVQKLQNEPSVAVNIDDL
ncbi:MAG: type II toxin-antitoxin system prevent-host-death family antitoxin [Alcaligenaceae bacterium]|nr:type II toxin-antitoxin system prevent-host-death family antitoxin [Alcaligenaceae bacterium]